MQTLLKCSMLMCLFFLCVLARGQTPIGITGPDTLCKGSSGSYVISPTTGYTYTWTVTSQGNITSQSSSGATVVWNGTGLATLTVNGVNGGSTQQGNKTVYVLPPPEPQMTWNSQVGCQITNPLGEGHDSSETSIGNSTCLRVCENSYVTYSVPNGGATSTFAWTVAGGTIVWGATSSSCVVHWGAAGNGSITVVETDAYGCSGTKTKCIEIIPGPTADFTVNPGMTACINQPLYFTDISTVGTGSPIVSWYWSFGDGTYSAVQNPTHAYTSGGTYPVMLIVKNECNCVDTITYDIEVSDVQAIPIHCPIVVCNGEVDRYWVNTDELADMGISCTSYVWDPSPYGNIINQGVTGNEAWVTVQWTQPMGGFGYLSFDAGNCSGTCPGMVVAKVPVVTNDEPIVGQGVICAGKQYRYTLPQWPATTFTWTLTPSTGATLIPTDQPNEYIVQATFGGTYKLKATWTKTLPENPCPGSSEIDITVEPPVSVTGALKACQNTSENYSLSGTSNPGNWTLNGPGGFLQTGSGTTSFTANFTVPGTYTLTVSGSFCAPDPLIIKVSPTPQVVDSIDGPDTVCLNTPYTFTAFDAAPGSLFYWEVVGGVITNTTNTLSDPGSNVSVTFTSATGPYKVKVWRKLKDAPYCESAKLEKVLYTPVITANITGPTNVCANTTASYNAGSGNGDIYEWTISPSVDGSIASGNNTSNVTVQWNKVTTAHFVDLNVTIKKCGLQSQHTLKVWVTPTVNVTITGPTTECRGVPVTFGFTPALSSSTSINWDFGDNNTASGTSAPTHAYISSIQANTTYTVSLEITGPNGCTVPAKANHTITIKPAPVANITPVGPINVCPPATHSTTLTATIQSGFGGPTSSINWYEASAPTISLNTTTSYAPPGNGTYYAVVANPAPNSCTASTNQVVFGNACPGSPCTISPNPTVSVSCSLSDCGEVTVTGSHTGSPVSGPVWTYPPQATASGTNPKVFTFDKAGYYDFSYKVTYMGTSGLCEREDQCSTTVPFVADLKYKLTCGTGNYNLTLLDNSNYIVPITNFAFYLYTGTIGTPAQSGTGTQYVTTVTPGVLYNAALKISAPGYPDCWKYITIQVPNLPVANFNIASSPGCEKTPIVFSNISTPNSNSPGPSPELQSDWDFDDLSGFIGWNATRTYSGPQSLGYDVTLTVTDKYGCTDIETKNVDIEQNLLLGDIDISPLNFCKGSPFDLVYTPNPGSATPNSYTWYNGSTSLGTTVVDHKTVFDPGSYWVEVEGNFGCKATTQPEAADYIHVPDAIIDGEKNYCSGEMVVLNGDGGAGVTNYQWFRNNVLIASGNVPILNDYVPTVGLYTYKLVISVTKGTVTCTDSSADFPVTISMPALPPGLSFTVNDCNTYEVEITATNSTTGTYTWSNGMSGNPITVYQGGPYKVFFQADNGCESSAEIDVPKDPEVYLWVFPTGCKALCPDDFPFTLYGPIIPFNWWEWTEIVGGSILSGTGLVTPYQVTGAGQYTLTLNNGHCTDRSGILDITMRKDYECPKGCDIDLQVDNINMIDEDGKCRYDLDITVNNPGPNTIFVTLTSPYGVFKVQPLPTPNMVVPVGSHPFQVEFHPNSGFAGGPTWIYIHSQQVTDDGTIIPCEDSIMVDFPVCAGPCEVEVSLDDIWIEEPCQIKVRLYINNMSGVTVTGNFSCLDGTLSPSSTSIAPGAGYYTFNFTPNGGFMGGGTSTIYFNATYMGSDGMLHYCYDEFTGEFPEQCTPEYENCGFGLFMEGYTGPYEPCNWYMYMAIHNPFPGTKQVTITSTVGSFSPSTYSIPSGTWNWLSPQPLFTPNPGFGGGTGWIILSSWYLNGNGDTVRCADSFQVNLPGCGGIVIGGKQSNSGDVGQALKDQSPDMFGQLELAPNPSKGTTTLRYHYTGDNANHERNIDVYDVMGRLIERIYVKGDDGVHILRLDNQPPGVYTIMMKENGKTIQHEKLIIAK